MKMYLVIKRENTIGAFELGINEKHKCVGLFTDEDLAQAVAQMEIKAIPAERKDEIQVCIQVIETNKIYKADEQPILALSLYIE